MIQRKGIYCTHSRNTEGRDFAVGDIHGAFDELEKKILALEFDYKKDRLFSVGDLVDRGMQSERALEYLSYPWFHAVMGNHEQMLCEWYEARSAGEVIKGGEGAPWSWMGSDKMTQVNGSWWAQKMSLEQLKPFYEAFKGLPVIREIDRGHKDSVAIVHADPRSVTADWETLRRFAKEFKVASTEHPRMAGLLLDSLLWERSTFNHFMNVAVYNGQDPSRAAFGEAMLTKQDHTEDFHIYGIRDVYVGHTPRFESVLTLGNVHYIDQGSPWFHRPGRSLTVLEI